MENQVGEDVPVTATRLDHCRLWLCSERINEIERVTKGSRDVEDSRMRGDSKEPAEHDLREAESTRVCNRLVEEGATWYVVCGIDTMCIDKHIDVE